MSAFKTLSIDDISARPDADGREWLPLRHELGVRAFGLNAWRGAAAGAEVIERHDETDYGHEEVYVVLRGRVRFEVAGEQRQLGPGDVVFVADPAAERRGVAEEDGTLVLTVGAAPGEAFSVSTWETRELGG